MPELKLNIGGGVFGFSWSKVQPWALYLLLAVVAVAEVVYSLLTMPERVDKITALLTTASQNQAQLDFLTKAQETVTAMDWDKVNGGLAKARAALPDEKKVSGLVSGLSVLASSSGTLLTAFDFAPGQVSTGSATTQPLPSQTVSEEVALGSGVKGLPATLTLGADLPSLATFLKKIENASQMLGVSHLQFGNFTGTGNAAELTILVYYQPLPAGSFDWKTVAPLSAMEEKTLTGLTGQDVFILR